MSISYEFFKNDEPGIGNLEESVIFIIDNYDKIMKVFRLIEAQELETQLKQEQAHEDLEELREKIASINQSGRKLTEQEKTALSEKETYLKNLRQETDIIYYKGQALERDMLVRTILAYKPLFTIIESLDCKVRSKICKAFKSGFKWAIKPFINMMRTNIRTSNSKSKINALRFAMQVLQEIPNDIENKIMSKTEVDLEEHRPVEKPEK